MPIAETFSFSGSAESKPQAGMPSGQFVLGAPIAEFQTLQHKNETTGFDLTTDNPVAIPFGSVTNATVFMIKVIGGKVAVAVTSDDGTAQTFPVNSFAFIMTDSGHAITAITVQREPGVTTTVTAFVGEAA